MRSPRPRPHPRGRGRDPITRRRAIAAPIIDRRDRADRIGAAGGDSALAAAMEDLAAAVAEMRSAVEGLQASYWRAQLTAAALIVGGVELVERVF